jgi:phosphatidylserine/phosphatidylglycerophosphate/cardiolipin synthase-like enzyme
VPKINGKYVIKLEDIFRICTEHYENKKALANEMYESIRDYLHQKMLIIKNMILIVTL